MKKIVRIIIGAACLVCLIIGSIMYIERPVTLRLGVFAGSNWDVPSPNSQKIIDHVIASFEEAHPNVSIEYISGLSKEEYSNWLSSQALNGELCDVYMVLSSDLSTFSSVGMLEPLDDYIEADENFDPSNFFSSSYASGVVNHQVMALPYESVPTLMFVNKSLLESNGIEIPTSDWSWQDFYSICSQVSKDFDGDGSLDQFGQFGYSWQDAFSSNGVTFFDEDQNRVMLDQTCVYEALDFVRNLYRLNQGQEVSSELFDQGQVAFCPMLFSEYRTYQPYPWRVKKYSSFEWDCIPMPAGHSGDNVSNVETLSFGISKTSNHKELAWELLKTFCYDEETQKELLTDSQGLSVLKSVSNPENIIEQFQNDVPGKNEWHLDFLSQTMEEGIVEPLSSSYDQIESLADSEIRRFLMTDEDVQITMKTLQNQLNALLDQGT